MGNRGSINGRLKAVEKNTVNPGDALEAEAAKINRFYRSLHTAYGTPGSAPPELVKPNEVRAHHRMREDAIRRAYGG